MQPEIERFVEAMGLHFESEGVPRIGGRIFAFLLLQDEPCSLDELADRLQVSKASVSSNARLLEQRGFLQRVARPGDRRDYYVPAPNQARMLELRLEGVRHVGNLLRDVAGALPRDRAVACRRLRQMVEFNDEAVACLGGLLERWRQQPTD